MAHNLMKVVDKCPHYRFQRQFCIGYGMSGTDQFSLYKVELRGVRFLEVENVLVQFSKGLLLKVLL